MKGITVSIGVAWLLAAVLCDAQPAEPSPDSAFAPATTADPGSLLVDGPVKPLVLARCDKCHGLAWIERSGGSEQGWVERVRRMNRAGAMIPPEEIPIIAAYLAKALPERLRPPPLPPKHRSSSAPRP